MTFEEAIESIGAEAVSEEELYRRYEESFDSIVGPVRVGNLTFGPSAVVRALDPVAYRVGFSDWLDEEVREERLVEYNDVYYEWETWQEVEETQEAGDAGEEENKRYVFTFGFAHVHFLGGVLLDHDSLLLVPGSYEAARARVVAHFGDVWSFQYEEGAFLRRGSLAYYHRGPFELETLERWKSYGEEAGEAEGAGEETTP